jgi:4-amino-4-deoxy-L-arabinose transferase-like glycosyltransferase
LTGYWHLGYVHTMTAARVREHLGRPALIFVVLLVIGFVISTGYGIARYQWRIVTARGSEFVRMWDFDALEQVLIAEAILSGKGYVVGDNAAAIEGKTVRFVGQPAVFKAPLYQYFLAGAFAISGFSFLLFFPLQALAAGGLSGLAGLVAREAFKHPAVAWFAGLAAAVQPVLVNTASQPYNEPLFFLLFLAAIWTFLRWLDSGGVRYAVACGCLIGLGTLTRETMLLPSAVMLVFGGVAVRRRPGATRGVAMIVATAVLVIGPWTVRNYAQLGRVVPVATMSGTVLAIGNNECMAEEGVFTPYWGDGRKCPALSAIRSQALARYGSQPDVILLDRVNAALGLKFIRENPVAYIRLCLQRAWSVFLPFHPRANQGFVQRAALLLYWLIVFPAGIVSLVILLRRRRPPCPAVALLAVVAAASLFQLVAIYYSPDLRYRVGVDLILGCFAGAGYIRWSGWGSSRS